MSSNWTRRRLSAAALAPALLFLACGGDNPNSNRIKPIQATLTIDPFLNSPDPAVYLVKDPKDARFPDLETVQVRLFTSGSAVTFDAYTIEIHFDPSLVQVGSVFEYDTGVLGGCNSGAQCAPLRCQVNTQDVNSTGVLLIAVVGSNNASCSPTTLTTDTMLVRIGFIAQTTIDPPGSAIDLFTNPVSTEHGDCEILLYDSTGLVDQGVLCIGGNALMTASR